MHEPGAQGIVWPLKMNDSSELIKPQHWQFERPSHGAVRPLFLPSAIDRRTDSFEPTLDAVFLTNLNKGAGLSLKELVLASSTELVLTVLTNLSSVG